jgi:ESS family glutamate:Na+ symporter
MITLDLIHALAFAGVVLFIGYGLCRVVRPSSRYNVPAPVVGGLLVAIIVLVARLSGVTLFQFDTTLRDPLMIAFFTTIGLGPASLS